MKIYLFVLMMILSLSASAQEKNVIDTDEKTGKPMLLGYFDRDALKDTSFSGWFNKEYDSYKPDLASLKTDSSYINNYTITIVMGTWCSDSHEQLPRFLKILDALKFNDKQLLTLIAVNRNKAGLGDETVGLKITAVPTFIIYKNKEEIGRIVETPKESLESDLTRIIMPVN